MGDISPRGEVRLTLDFEGRKFVVRGLVDGPRAAKGVTGLLELAPAMYLDLLRAIEKYRDRQESRS